MPQAFFFPFSQCLQAELILASPVTECRAQNLHYSLASFVTGTKARDLLESDKYTTKFHIHDFVGLEQGGEQHPNIVHLRSGYSQLVAVLDLCNSKKSD